MASTKMVFWITISNSFALLNSILDLLRRCCIFSSVSVFLFLKRVSKIEILGGAINKESALVPKKDLRLMGYNAKSYVDKNFNLIKISNILEKVLYSNYV